MKYYSTNHKAPNATLREAVEHGLAKDRGLYMPENIKPLAKDFFRHIEEMSFQEMATEVAKSFFGDEVDAASLQQIVCDTLSFDTPVVNVEADIFALELYHGPTLAFKDVGARFMARLLQYFIKKDTYANSLVNVLVATSGDTGSAVANGFLGMYNIHVYVLYPKGKVSKIQESQFTTLGKNITALEVDGVFDDCQALVKNAFMDADLNKQLTLTSANSINIARFLPQAFYYFNAFAQLKKTGRLTYQDNNSNLVVCVPSGNLGNLTAGLFAKKMGLPIKRFIASNNANDVFFKYLQTGEYQAKPSLQTIANAMDVGDPSNFARIIELYSSDWKLITSDISGASYQDQQICEAMKACYEANGYILDPHGACGYQALKDHLANDEIGVFLETAHPAKFKEKVDSILNTNIDIPQRLQNFMNGTKHSIEIDNNFEQFKEVLLNRQ